MPRRVFFRIPKGRYKALRGRGLILLRKNKTHAFVAAPKALVELLEGAKGSRRIECPERKDVLRIVDGKRRQVRTYATEDGDVVLRTGLAPLRYLGEPPVRAG